MSTRKPEHLHCQFGCSTIRVMSIAAYGARAWPDRDDDDNVLIVRGRRQLASGWFRVVAWLDHALVFHRALFGGWTRLAIIVEGTTGLVGMFNHHSFPWLVQG